MLTTLFSLAFSAIFSVSSAHAQPTASDQVSVYAKVEDVWNVDVKETRTMTITAYSSSKDETDSTPFITASNTRVRDGVVATNILPFGIRVRIPSLFGGREFVVEDRMHPRHQDRLDIWFPSRREALRFGIVHGASVEVLR